jgi:hypothetical protein
VAVIVGVDYVAWRFAVTLNPAAMWLSLPVWLAELYGLLSTILFTFIVWGPIKRRLVAPPARRLSVDIFAPSSAPIVPISSNDDVLRRSFRTEGSSGTCQLTG